MPEWTNFEDRVFTELQWAISTGLLPFARDAARIRRGPSYPTADGKRSITMDVAVEVYRHGAAEPFLISIWECKHKSNRKVEVGVIRELRSKIEEIGVSRCTGAVVTTRGFQAGAIELAAQHGIWLMTLEDRLVWITKYAKGANNEQRQVLYATHAVDDSGRVLAHTLFADLVRLRFRREGVVNA